MAEHRLVLQAEFCADIRARRFGEGQRLRVHGVGDDPKGLFSKQPVPGFIAAGIGVGVQRVERRAQQPVQQREPAGGVVAVGDAHPRAAPLRRPEVDGQRAGIAVQMHNIIALFAHEGRDKAHVAQRMLQPMGRDVQSGAHGLDLAANALVAYGIGQKVGAHGGRIHLGHQPHGKARQAVEIRRNRNQLQHANGLHHFSSPSVRRTPSSKEKRR